jgi:hypothetical protein
MRDFRNTKCYCLLGDTRNFILYMYRTANLQGTELCVAEHCSKQFRNCIEDNFSTKGSQRKCILRVGKLWNVEHLNDRNIFPYLLHS